MEISSEILFEEHAAVFEHAVLEIASDMGIALTKVEFVHCSKIGTGAFHFPFHTLNYSVTNFKGGGIYISEDDVSNIPVWPPPDSFAEEIRSSLSRTLSK